MIIILLNPDLIADDAWDYPLEEMDYLMQEYYGQAFVLKDGRLWETGRREEDD